MSGQRTHVENFIDTVRVEKDGVNEPADLSLSKIRPEPRNLGDEWYEWRIANWGTKWDTADCVLEIMRMVGDNEPGLCRVCYSFDTAWGPPIEAIRYGSSLWTPITFILSYDEPGADFGGFMVLHDGKITHEQSGGSRAASWDQLADYEIESAIDGF